MIYCILIYKKGGENVLVENSIARQAFCYSIGTGATPIIKNVTIRNVIAQDCVCGLKLKGKRGNWVQNGTMSFITFENVTLENVNKGIMINDFNQTGEVYNNKSNNNNVGFISFHDITFKNIYGTYNWYAGQLDCSQYTPCYDLIFDNILMDTSNNTALNWTCSDHVYGSDYNVTPPLTCLEPMKNYK